MKPAIKLFSLAILVAIAGCSTVPQDAGFTKVDDLSDRTYAAVVVSDLDSKEETAGFVAGAGKALGSEKIIPNVPDVLQGPIKKSLGSDKDSVDAEWVEKVIDLASKAFEFDTLMVTHAFPFEQQIKVIGIPVRSQPVTAVYSFAIDAETKEVVARAVKYVMYNEKSAVPSATSAGQAGMKAILTAEMQE